MVSTAHPSAAVGRGQEGIDLWRAEETDLGSVPAFGWDGQDSLDDLRVFGVAQGSEAEQRVDRCQAEVAGGTVLPRSVFEMVEEGRDDRVVEVGDVELRWCPAGAVRAKPSRSRNVSR